MALYLASENQQQTSSRSNAGGQTKNGGKRRKKVREKHVKHFNFEQLPIQREEGQVA